MKAKADEIGRVAVSLKGHDQGRWMAIVALDGADFALVCDGETRTLEKPKKKRLKHLKPLPLRVELTGKGASGGAVQNSDVRKALRAAKEEYLSKLEGDRDGGAS